MGERCERGLKRFLGGRSEKLIEKDAKVKIEPCLLQVKRDAGKCDAVAGGLGLGTRGEEADVGSVEKEGGLRGEFRVIHGEATCKQARC
jgi:hypothetical protein